MEVCIQPPLLRCVPHEFNLVLPILPADHFDNDESKEWERRLYRLTGTRHLKRLLTGYLNSVKILPSQLPRTFLQHRGQSPHLLRPGLNFRPSLRVHILMNPSNLKPPLHESHSDANTGKTDVKPGLNSHPEPRPANDNVTEIAPTATSKQPTTTTTSHGYPIGTGSAVVNGRIMYTAKRSSSQKPGLEQFGLWSLIARENEVSWEVIMSGVEASRLTTRILGDAPTENKAPETSS
ncbi:hypothetical protein QBC35DRAFT_479220 [Podospora australis]|uniref:Uncharacterized protein n=1 Tax=Podospora australis TaxID=1536484 RepID=A0AAN6WHM7_9PEZI|nr:hypothetical protein QBC35DRAFT_479220 [Podospora australis]